MTALLSSMSIYWQLPILIVVISLVYSATRYDQWGDILRESVRWARNMAGFLAAIALVLYVVAIWI